MVSQFYLKVYWSRSEKEDGWTTMPLMLKILPWATLWMLFLMPLMDPPGLLDYPWQPESAALILASGLAAFCVNYSGFLVLGQCRPLTHVVLGQLKSGVVILGGFFLFQKPQSPRALFGSALAVAFSGVYAYSR
jgi:solute carrier family 35 protein E3